MICTALRVFASHVSKAFILGFFMQSMHCIPVPGAMESNRVSSTEHRVKERIFDVIMRANKERNIPSIGNIGLQRKPADHVQLFQGDIVMTEDVKRALQQIGNGNDILSLPSHKFEKHEGNRQRRAASANKIHKWPVVNGSRQVPYVIDASSVPDKSVILQAFNHWNQNVPCVTFVPRSTQSNYVSFFAGKGCYSWIGRTGGKQRISIGKGCAVMGAIAHEIGHTLGFWHEQSRPDRDNYVKILWDNIRPDKTREFTKVEGTNDLGVPYDLNSLMHFSPSAFAKAENLNTIVKLDGGTDFGQVEGLSDKDVQQARLLYCPGTDACKSLYNDTRVECEAWSNLGYCHHETYKVFMKTNCQRSCVCQVCEDKHDNCAAYVAVGYCTNPQYKSFMELYCRKGCKLCP